jgi:hypothetical protein
MCAYHSIILKDESARNDGNLYSITQTLITTENKQQINRKRVQTLSGGQ